MISKLDIYEYELQDLIETLASEVKSIERRGYIHDIIINEAEEHWRATVFYRQTNDPAPLAKTRAKKRAAKLVAETTLAVENLLTSERL